MTKETRKWMFAASTLMAISLLGSIFVVTAVADMGFLAAVGVVQAAVTLVAIGLGGVFAYYKLDLFRDFQPHLTITQEVSHRRVGDRYVHISVRASLVNTSKVKIEIRNATFWMQQVAPFPDEEVEGLHEEFMASPNHEKYIAYPTLVAFDRDWEEDEFVIEPGESGSENYEFIVKNDFDSVSLYAFFNDQTTDTNPRDQKGWAAEAVYDIKLETG